MSDTVDALLREHAHTYDAKDAVVDPGERVSYRDLDTDTLALAAVFVEAGVNKGSRVGVIAPNGVRWVRIVLALSRIGAVVVPLSTLLSAPELTAALRTAAVQHLVTVDEFRGRRYLDALPPKDAVPALQRIHRVEDLATDAGTRAHGVAWALAHAVRPADALAILFTSGSSGDPKGVRHTHGNAIDAVRSGLSARCINADTRLYLPMPLFWVGGFAGGLMSALVAGATLVTEPAPQPDSTLRLLDAERVTLFRGWPEQAEALAQRVGSPGGVEADLSALGPGSLEALLPEAQRPQPGARARLFGMTETFGPYCGFRADTDMPESAWGSCGRPFDGIAVRIVDPDSGAPTATGQTGMIQVRGGQVMRGIVRRSREEVFTADGYYPTGDLGRLDARGFLFFHGRCDDMFKVSGATVYPGEVERALRTLAGVRAAFVTNVPGPVDNRVAAAVVCDGPATVEELRAAAKAVLSAFKVPTVWMVLDDEDCVPRGGSGKVDTARLRALFDGR